MLLCDDTIWALPDGASGIEFKDKEVGDFFVNCFNEEWECAIKAVAEEHEDCLQDDPASVTETENGILVSFYPLDIPFMDGQYCDIERGPEALQRAVCKVKEKYPDAEYRGCIQYGWSDAHGGDIVKFDVSSAESDEPYPFVGDILKEAVEDEDEYFWDEIEESDYIDEIAEDLKAYKDWVGEDAITRIEKMQ